MSRFLSAHPSVATVASMPSGGAVFLVAEKSCQFRLEDGIDAFFDLAAKKFIGSSTTLE